MSARDGNIEACKTEIVRLLPADSLPVLQGVKRAKKVVASVDEDVEEDTPDVVFAQSLKIQAVAEEVNNFLATNKLKDGSSCPSSLLSARFDPKVYSTDRALFSTSPPKAEREVSSLRRPPALITVSMKRWEDLETQAREQVALTSFTEQASHAMAVILNQDHQKPLDVDALHRLVRGINRSALVAAGSPVLLSTNLQLGRRDAHLEKISLYAVHKMKLRSAPVEGEDLFGGLLTSVREDISRDLPMRLWVSNQGRHNKDAVAVFLGKTRNSILVNDNKDAVAVFLGKTRNSILYDRSRGRTERRRPTPYGNSSARGRGRAATGGSARRH